jgi:hypothetical protein
MQRALRIHARRKNSFEQPFDSGGGMTTKTEFTQAEWEALQKA